MTIHFYSPSAYDYLRSVFSLPHPSSLGIWTNSIKCEPVFFPDVFNRLSEITAKINKNVIWHCYLMFMLVNLRASWKYPIGYVLIDKTNSDDLYCLVSRALDLCIKYDLNVRTVTCDGTSTNFPQSVVSHLLRIVR